MDIYIGRHKWRFSAFSWLNTCASGGGL